MKKQPVFLFLILFGVLIFFSFFTFYNTLDPDFGWHIKTGQLILERGVPKIDWYSYTMPNFPWIDHEWLMDVLMYQGYLYVGIQGLLLIFLVFYTSSFFIIKKRNQDFWTFLVPVLFGYLATLYFLGIRPQLFTVLFIALLMKLISEFLENNSKIIYVIPILFIAWVNLHASFFAGLVILLAVLLLEVFKKLKIGSRLLGNRGSSIESGQRVKVLGFLNNLYYREQSSKNILTLGSILVVSFLVTALNPYGFSIYQEVFRTIGDNFLRFNVTEWLPLFVSGFKPFIYFYMGLFIGLLFLYYKKIEFNQIMLSLFFFFLSLTSIRYTLVFVIISLPATVDMFGLLKNDFAFKKTYQVINTFDKWLLVCVLLLVCAIFGYGFYDFFRGMEDKEFYPKEAIGFLKTLPLTDNLLNDYDFGGYLIWKIPERQYFIDGRMPSWRLPAQAGQDGQFAFGDYVTIIKARDGFQEKLKKYDVKYVLLQKFFKDKHERSQGNVADKKVKEFFKEHNWLGYMLGISSDNNIYEELIKLGWSVIYEDEAALIMGVQR